MLHKPAKQGIFKRIFIIYALILLTAALVVELAITDTVRRSYINGLRNNLTVQANLIANEISFDAPSPLDRICRQFREKTDARVTIIALDGKVLGDSETDSTRMDNHRRRPEIQQALLEGTGMSIRFSHTLKNNLLYVAKRISRDPLAGGYIRLSVPLTEVDRSINRLRTRIILVVTLLLLATSLVSLWQLERIRRLTVRIRDFSRSVAGGEFGGTLFLEQAGEFDDIATSLNAMSGDLKKSMSAHEDEQRRLNVILRSIPDALFIIDAKGLILLSSSATAELFPGAPFRGKPYIEVVRNTDFLALMEDVRSKQAAGSAEVRLDYPEERHCIVQANPLFYKERELSGFVIVFHDVTRLKKLEQTRKDFVANISHEIKTPITAIAGFAETLLEGALDDREHAATFLRTIKSNSDRINSLIDDLMTISKLELGVIKINKSSIDPREAIGQVLHLLQDKANRAKLSITTAFPDEVNAVQADRDRLIQILTNLMDNAIKFTPEGGSVLLGARIIPCNEGNEKKEEELGPGPSRDPGKGPRSIELFVEDTGIGIPKKHLPRIGERFYRVDPGRSRNMGGTGLGLAIVKHLVQAHGWDLRIESTPGKGTKVRICIS